jgi:hypothetical protein
MADIGIGAVGTVAIGNGAGVSASFSDTPPLTGVTFPAAGGAGTTPTSDTQGTYEFGTFVPTLDGAVSGTTTYTSRNGYYVKIGNMVTVCGQIITTASTGTGQVQLGALPFTSNSGTNNVAVGSIRFGGSGWTWPVGRTQAILQLSAGANFAVVQTAGTAVNNSAMQMANAALNMAWTLTYFV